MNIPLVEKNQKTSQHLWVIFQHLVKQMLHHGQYMAICVEDLSLIEFFFFSGEPDYVGVSENSGTPKSSILIGFSIINHPFWGIFIFGNTHVDPHVFLFGQNVTWVSDCSWKKSGTSWG